jgi:2-amino-4-hydroxy-6-hydroxymethyldihydropteridine diphosphokinase
VVVLEGELGLSVASAGAALELLMGLHQLEQLYGRQRRERWGPRSLDLDLLWWGDLAVATARLALPHPRWHQRSFVLAPLLAIERRRGEPLWCPHPAGLDAAAAAAVCVAATESPPQSVPQSPPQPLPPRTGWPE